ncbi:response regulator [Halogeometricum borinquense]|uniref:histidine kinase n=1 Tax=Halogeometricum borinquense TaxID=60847 RepID=A0A6C0UGT1_9EURY|nr:response regulator [Halogeometricum borinquense]QIB74682.1 response regulator [Halogeometricum borinquense]QIQ76364.1 response regulator [Halogeometricum borinquense]
MPSLRKGISVLYVDDEPELSSLVATYLEREAADVHLSVETATNPRDALDLLSDAQDDFDCIVSDYEMPEMNGLELLRAVRATRPNLPFILYTGKGSEEVARDAFRVGATDYMQKTTGTDQYAVLANRVINAVSRNRAEEATERYDSVFEALETAVYVVDESGQFVSVDDVFVELIGYDRETILGNHVSSLSPDDEQKIRDELDRLFAKDGVETTRFETDVCTASKERIHCIATMSFKSFEGGTQRVVGTLHGVTEQRGQQERDQYLARLKDAVLDTSTTLMSAEVDEIGTKIHWTLQSLGEFADVDGAAVYSYDSDVDALQKTHEWTIDDQFPLPSTVRGDDWTWFLERLRCFENVRATDASTLSTSEPEPLCLPENGSFLALPMVSNWSLVGAVTLMSTTSRQWSDKEVSLFGTAADMLSYTLERQQRERQLRQQNERLEEFASVVSHDLRNPMNVVDGFMELARDTGDVSHLDRAMDALDRMDALVNDVLELARQGRTVGETAPVDLTGVVRRAWSAVETGEATLELDDDLATVSADASRLTQVFENLVRNAVEHGGDDVTISVGPLPQTPGFYVEDDGPGIPEADRSAVFEQGHTTSEDGSGFGLSIVEGIVEAHGWTIGVTEGSDGGARFEIITAPHTQTFSQPHAN